MTTEELSLNRRNFLKVSAGTVGAALMAGALAGCSPQETEGAADGEGQLSSTQGSGVSPLDPSDRWYFDFSTLPPLEEATDECDVVVVGSGFGGMACAISAADLGLSVIQLEALSVAGGTSPHAEGTYCGGCDILSEAGFPLPEGYVEEHVEEKLVFSHYRADRDCLNFAMEKGADVGNWMEEQGVPFAEVDVYDLLGRKRDLVTSMVYEPNAGSAIDTFEKRAQEKGVDFRLSTKAEHLYWDDGVVKGVYVTGPDGEYAIKAKAVMLACGGFSNNPEMMALKTGFDASRIVFTGTPNTGTGEGLRMAYEAGAEQNGVTCPGFVWLCIDGVDPHCSGSIIACNEMGLFVNQDGKRFINEDILFDPSIICNIVLAQPHAWSIVPQNEVDRHAVEPCFMGWGSYQAFGSVMEDSQESIDSITSHDMPNARKVDTLEEAAEVIGCDAATLKATVENYNAMCVAGEDTELGKQAMYMKELQTGPYYVFELYCNSPSTLGGVRVNPKAEVIDQNFEPIPGLYSASIDNSGLNGDTNMNNPGGVNSSFAMSCGIFGAQAAADYIKTV